MSDYEKEATFYVVVEMSWRCDAQLDEEEAWAEFSANGGPGKWIIRRLTSSSHKLDVDGVEIHLPQAKEVRVLGPRHEQA